MTGVNAPIRYFGGKGNFVGKLLSFFPLADSYNTFIDVYGGSGVVLLNKPQVEVEVYNDLDRNVYALFQVLQDAELFAVFVKKCELALYDEATSDAYEVSLGGELAEPMERAFRFWYVARTRRGGGLGGFSFNTIVRRRMSKSTSDFLSAVDRLPQLHQRLSTVIVRNMDALELIEHSDMPRTLLYLDPPYLHSTRTSARYRTDATTEHHHQLVEVLAKLRHAYVALSGYDNPLYATLPGFKRHAFEVRTVTGANERKTKTECVWLNYPPPQLSLFDLEAEGERALS